MNTNPILDITALRNIMGPRGEWAKACGARVAARRKALRLDIQHVANLTGIPVQTIYRVEAGALVPRDYLRALISCALAVEVIDLWPPMSRADIHKAAA